MELLTNILNVLFYTVQLIVALYLVTPFILLIIYALFKILNIKTAFQRRPGITDHDFEFGIIITAHQDTKFIAPLIDSIQKQGYKKYYVYIVADDCNTTSLVFENDRIHVLQPATPLNSKIKSIQYAISHFQQHHDALIILDADNLIHPAFLQVMNTYFQKGYKVVQADFKPKNTDTTYARMDAIGDMFNFFVEREVRMMMGLSATIWGSGIAIDFNIYKEVVYADFLGGFDKKLQAHLVQRAGKIAFAPDAILFDEKITTGSSLENQRTRWISSYFKYFKENFEILFTGLKKGSFNLVYFGFHTLRPPLFIILGAAFLITVISGFTSTALFYTWLSLFLSFFVTFFLIVLIKGRDSRYIKTLFSLPLFILRQMIALFKLQKAKKTFLKTEHHNVIYIDDLLKSGKWY